MMTRMRLCLVIGAALVLLACEKSSSPTGGAQAVQEPAPSSAPAATATAPVVTASAPAATATVSPTDASAAAVATAADAGKGRDGGGAGALRPVSKHVDGNNFALDLASPGCKAGAECAMTIKLVAGGGYHVNKDYPYKFIATASPGIEFLGKGEAGTFTRAAGDFVEHGETSGTMTVRFKPASPGEARVAGTYKFSVCSDDQCQIEQEKLELNVPVI